MNDLILLTVIMSMVLKLSAIFKENPFLQSFNGKHGFIGLNGEQCAGTILSIVLLQSYWGGLLLCGLFS